MVQEKWARPSMGSGHFSDERDVKGMLWARGTSDRREAGSADLALGPRSPKVIELDVRRRGSSISVERLKGLDWAKT
jgi:hypothetical protein